MENSQITGYLILNARNENYFSEKRINAATIEEWDKVVIDCYEDTVAEMHQYCSIEDNDALYTATFDVLYRAADANGQAIHDGRITGEGFDFIWNLRNSLRMSHFDRLLDEGYSDEEARVLIGPRH